MIEQAEIGIFGGTGIYDSGLLTESKEITVETPFGKTSDSITVGIYKGSKAGHDGPANREPSHSVEFCVP